MSNYSRWTKQRYYDELIARAQDGRFPAGYSKKYKDTSWDGKIEEYEKYICMYRQGDKACAAGILIPNELYDDSIETKVAHNSDVFNKCVFAPEGTNESELRAIQNCHDNMMIYDNKKWNADKFIQKLKELSA